MVNAMTVDMVTAVETGRVTGVPVTVMTTAVATQTMGTGIQCSRRRRRRWITAEAPANRTRHARTTTVVARTTLETVSRNTKGGPQHTHEIRPATACRILTNPRRNGIHIAREWNSRRRHHQSQTAPSGTGHTNMHHHGQRLRPDGSNGTTSCRIILAQ